MTEVALFDKLFETVTLLEQTLTLLVTNQLEEVFPEVLGHQSEQSKERPTK